MILNIVLLLVGLIALVKGADYLVDGASFLALKKKVSKLAIGLTIVAFGTSAPELVVNTVASYQNFNDLVFGNVLGSNNFNLLVILGIVGLMSPIAVKSSTIWKEIPISLFAAIFAMVIANDALIFGFEGNVVSRLNGAMLVTFFVLFVYYVYLQMKTGGEEVDVDIDTKSLSNTQTWVYIIGGLAGLIIGGQMVVSNAVSIAASLGISEKIIGLTIVAFGTSLPELTTSIVAVRKKSSDLAVGNIIGSNIFNLFLILGVSALIRPINYNLLFNTDFYLLLAGTAFLFIAMFTGKKGKLDRWEAAILLLAYVLYMGWLLYQELI